MTASPGVAWSKPSPHSPGRVTRSMKQDLRTLGQAGGIQLGPSWSHSPTAVWEEASFTIWGITRVWNCTRKDRLRPVTVLLRHSYTALKRLTLGNRSEITFQQILTNILFLSLAIEKAKSFALLRYILLLLRLARSIYPLNAQDKILKKTKILQS